VGLLGNRILSSKVKIKWDRQLLAKSLQCLWFCEKVVSIIQTGTYIRTTRRKRMASTNDPVPEILPL
jgi:hypothetical protein